MSYLVPDRIESGWVDPSLAFRRSHLSNSDASHTNILCIRASCCPRVILSIILTVADNMMDHVSALERPGVEDLCSSSGEEIEVNKDEIISRKDVEMEGDQDEIANEEDKEMEEDPEVITSNGDEEIDEDLQKTTRKVSKEVRASRAKMLLVILLRIFTSITLLAYVLCRRHFGEIPGVPVGAKWRTRCAFLIFV
jgi:hypothetical protein